MTGGLLPHVCMLKEALRQPHQTAHGASQRDSQGIKKKAKHWRGALRGGTKKTFSG